MTADTASPATVECHWCGCDVEQNPKARVPRVTCSASHRAKRHRWLHQISTRRDGVVEQPPEGSPMWRLYPDVAVIHSLNTLASPPRGPRAGRNARSGITVSFHKAVHVLAEELEEHGWGHPEADAVAILRDALTPMQRARLDEREARHA